MPDIIDVNTLFGPLPIASSDLAVETLLELMQKHEVSAAYTLSTLGLLLDPTVGNASTRAACGEHPELRPVATLNPTMHFGDSSALLRLPSEGFAFIRFFPQRQGWPVDFAPFRAMIHCLDEAALPLMIDVCQSGEITRLSDVLENYPGAVLLSGVDTHLLAESIAVMRHRANWYIETSHLLAPGCLKLTADTIGAERLLFGTGAPSQPVASALETLRYSGLSTSAQNAILAGNARRVLAQR